MNTETVLAQITGQKGAAVLSLTPSHVVMELSESLHDDISGKMQDAREKLGAGFLGKVVGAALKLGEKALDAQARIPLTEIARAVVVNGELQFQDHQGAEVKFKGLRVTSEGLRGFRDGDVQGFADAVNRQIGTV